MRREKKNISLKEKYEISALDIDEFIEEENFIEGEDYLNFLSQNGYNVVGYYCSEGDTNSGGKWFYPFNDWTPWLDNALILLGNEECKAGSKGFYCEKIAGNHYIRRISMSLTQFEIYTVLKYKHWEKVEKDNVYAYVTNGNLEKDLSMEWIKFLAETYVEYKNYILDRYKWVKTNALIRKERIEQAIAKRDGSSANKLEGALEQCEQMIAKSDYIVDMLTAGKEL